MLALGMPSSHSAESSPSVLPSSSTPPMVGTKHTDRMRYCSKRSRRLSVSEPPRMSARKIDSPEREASRTGPSPSTGMVTWREASGKVVLRPLAAVDALCAALAWAPATTNCPVCVSAAQ